MSSQTPADRFYTNFDHLGHDLSGFIRKANELGFTRLGPEIITLAKGFVSVTYTRTQIIESFIRGSYPLWPKINLKMNIDRINETIISQDKDIVNDKVKLIERIRSMSPQTKSWSDDFIDTLIDNQELTEIEKLVENNIGILFPILDPQYFEPFADLWKVYLTETDKKVVWKYVYAFVKISIKYIHECRYPMKNDKDWSYTGTFMEIIYERKKEVVCPKDVSKKCKGCEVCGIIHTISDSVLRDISLKWDLKLTPLNT